MLKIYIKIFKKIGLILLMFTITIGIYIFTKDNVEEMVNLNLDNPLNRYIIDANFYPKDRIDIDEKIIFNNNFNKGIEKIYLYIASKEIKINNIIIDKEKALYKIIGKDNDILMIILNEPLKPNKNIVINLDSSIKTRKKNSILLLNNWYPIIAKIDNGLWNMSVNSSSKFDSVLNGNYSLNISVPIGYRMSSLGEVKSENIIGNRKYYSIEAFNVKYIPIMLDGSIKLKE